MTPALILDFVKAEGNVLLTLSSSTPVSTSIVSTLLELDIHLPPDRSGIVVDHFNYDLTSASEKHDVLLVPAPGTVRPGIKDFFAPEAPNGELLAFPRGVGQTLGQGPLLTPVLRAPTTAYSYDPKEENESLEDVFATGSQLSLVTAMQARNSARFAVVGSAEMLSDEWFDAKVKKAGADAKSVKTLNREFAKNVAGWTFNEIGVLRVNWVEHHLNEPGSDNTTNPGLYRIKNDVVSFSSSRQAWQVIKCF